MRYWILMLASFMAWTSNAQEPPIVASVAMSLRLTAEKRQVYVGEPLRIELTWQCNLPANGLSALRLNPAFFNDPDIQVVVPRNTDLEDQQVGLPLGGRRVIAKRLKDTNDPDALGVITLPIYLRFKQAGNITLPAVRLECAFEEKGTGGFARYAAYFNNSLFENADASKPIERIYTTTDPIEIEVLALPPVPTESEFSGLFEPLGTAVSISSTEVKVGELMTVEIQLSSPAPHGMLALPTLSQQAGLRERFLIDDNLSQIWHAGGTIFRTRVRALSTSVHAFPALRLQVFDPAVGKFVMQTTDPIPLIVSPSNGQDYIALKSFQGAAVELTNQPAGIWHNLKNTLMNDLLNTLYGILLAGFWPLLLLGPIAFVLLLPIIRERRRRANDRSYREIICAYRAFKKQSDEPRKQWSAFIRLLAVAFDADSQAWTRSDSEKALQQIEADPSAIASVLCIHDADDAEQFGRHGAQVEIQGLGPIAKRIVQCAPTLMILLFLVLAWTPQLTHADTWTEAESTFEAALNAPQGSEQAHALYAQSALLFEHAAKTRIRSGPGWYNTGNAWLQAGEIGRAIAAYREAERIRPFDTQLADNLAAARAMTLNDVPVKQFKWKRVPFDWLKGLLVLLNLLFWIALLMRLRYRNRAWHVTTLAVALPLLLLAALWGFRTVNDVQAGVVVVDSAYARKGPSYAYGKAFNEALHDGLEFVLIEQRDGWSWVELQDMRTCWLPSEQVQLIGQ
jgi:tetratricopeptide (TPR) repeat protein